MADNIYSPASASASTARLNVYVPKFTNTPSQASLQKNFERDNVKLDNGEYILKKDFDTLSKEDQDQIKFIGIKKFNELNKGKLEAFLAVNLKLPDNKYIKKTDAEKIQSEYPELYQILITQGYDAYRKAKIIPFPDNVNPYRHYGMYYFWTDEQIEDIYGPRPTPDDPRYNWTGQYGSGAYPIPSWVKDESQLAAYLYNAGKTTIPTVPITPGVDVTVSGTVIGVNPNAGQVLVKDTQGNTTWQPGTPEQITQATQVLNMGDPYGKPYTPPVSGQGTPQKITLDTPAQQLSSYNSKLEAFNNKYEGWIQDGKFTGKHHLLLIL